MVSTANLHPYIGDDPDAADRRMMSAGENTKKAKKERAARRRPVVRQCRLTSG